MTEEQVEELEERIRKLQKEIKELQEARTRRFKLPRSWRFKDD